MSERAPNKLINIFKGFLNIRGYNLKDFAEYIGIPGSNLSRRGRRNFFTVYDLTRLAELTETELAFIDKETGDVLLKIASKDAVYPLPSSLTEKPVKKKPLF